VHPEWINLSYAVTSALIVMVSKLKNGVSVTLASCIVSFLLKYCLWFMVTANLLSGPPLLIQLLCCSYTMENGWL
jgi:hypothetical protein